VFKVIRDERKRGSRGGKNKEREEECSMKQKKAEVAKKQIKQYSFIGLIISIIGIGRNNRHSRY